MSKKQLSKAWGNTALVTGILGLVLFLAPYFGLPLSVFAIIAAAQQNKIKSNGNAQAGKIMGIIGICINAIVLLIILAFWGAVSAAM